VIFEIMEGAERPVRRRAVTRLETDPSSEQDWTDDIIHSSLHRPADEYIGTQAIPCVLFTSPWV